VQVSPCKAERYGTQMGDRSDAYADDSSAEQPGLDFFIFFLSLGFVYCVSCSKVSRSSTSGGGGCCHEWHTKFRRAHN